MFAELQTLLEGHGFILAPEKVQMQPPYSSGLLNPIHWASASEAVAGLLPFADPP